MMPVRQRMGECGGTSRAPPSQKVGLRFSSSPAGDMIRLEVLSNVSDTGELWWAERPDCPLNQRGPNIRTGTIWLPERNPVTQYEWRMGGAWTIDDRPHICGRLRQRGLAGAKGFLASYRSGRLRQPTGMLNLNLGDFMLMSIVESSCTGETCRTV